MLSPKAQRGPPPGPAGRANGRRASPPRSCFNAPVKFAGLWWFPVATALACTSRAEEPRTLRVLQVRPADATGVFLNEPVVFHFSEPLDPTSVTEHSVRIRARDAGRTPARGRLRVTGRTLLFTPEPVLAFDLDDGGYLPDTTYEVELAGFPRPDGLRGRSGAPLERSLSWEFKTVTVSEPRSGFVFEDASLDRGLPVVLATSTVAPGEPIVLEGEEPVDPSTLFAVDFVLRRKLPRSPEGPVRSLGPPIPLRVGLADNRDKRAPGEPGQTTRIELLPLQRLAEGETYWLQVDPRFLRLRDFGGHPVRVFAPRGGPLLIEVSPFPSGVPRVHPTFTETFIDAELRSAEPVAGVDGTVHWATSGRAEIRFPAAAGTGAAGHVVLGERETESDVQATDLHLPAGGVCALSNEPGPVVLRAQGALRIEGILRRTAGRGAPQSPLFRKGETLSDWLVRARSDDLDCTVLIAGGDLVIEGRVEVDGPLLLAAGGRIRSAGRNVHATFAYTVEAEPLSYSRPARDNQNVEDSGLILDPPEENLLRSPLVFGVRSVPIPPEGEAARWYPAPRVGGHAGAGEFRVRFVGRGAHGTEAVLDDPLAFEDSPTLRLEILLEMPPGGVWDPPWVDSVQVGWEPRRDR